MEILWQDGSGYDDTDVKKIYIQDMMEIYTAL